MKTKLNEILEELKKPLSYKWKPQSQNKDKTKWQCVAYIDSRDVQNILDTTCIWQNEFYEVKWKLFCKIWIYTEDYWTLWRSDSWFLENEFIEDWTESKWEVSDTFKRAWVQWWIWRFLYSKQIQWITSEEYNVNKYKLTEFIESKLNNWNYTTPKKEVPKAKEETKVSESEACPDCWTICDNVRNWITKTWKPYEMWNCECWTKFFINRKAS